MGVAIPKHIAGGADNTGHGLAYVRVMQHITKEIVSGRLAVGATVPSESRLAAEFGVSTGTAKLALSKLSAVGILKRQPRVGTFVAAVPQVETSDNIDAQPQQIQSQQPQANVKTVYLVVPCLPDSYLMSIVEGVCRTARLQGIDVVLRITDHDRSVESSVLHEIWTSRRAAGVIIFPVDGHVICHELLRMVLDRVPLVVVDREYHGITTDCVIPDHVGGAKLAVEHLLQLGHEAIGFISVDISHCSASEARYSGYLEALAHSSAFTRSKWVLNSGELVMDVPEVSEQAVATLASFLKNNRELTAVVCANDYLAVALSHAARQIGLMVPEDLSIVGFSNNLIGQRHIIPITTIEHGQDVTGEKAMELLLNKMTTPSCSSRRICLPAQLIVRQSTGSPSAFSSAVAINGQ